MSRTGFRSPRGVDHPSAKLTEDDVREIRRLYAAGGVTYKQLGERYGLVVSNVMRIVKRHAWRHVK